MMCSSNCARSSWIRLASAACLLLLLAAGAAAAVPEAARAGDLEQAWFKLAPALGNVNPDQLREGTDELLQTARRMDIERLTPFALALVVRSRAVPPGQAEVLLAQAARLDPESAEVAFAIGSRKLRSGSVVAGIGQLAHGIACLLGDARLAHIVRPGALIALLIVFLFSFTVWGLLAIRRAFPRLWHDLTELGTRWRLGGNAAFVAVLAVALPAVVGFDPVWVALWVFALCWAYFTPAHKALGVLGLALVAASPTLLEIGFRSLTHPPNALAQAAAALDAKRYDPQLLDEIASLSDLLGEEAEFRLLQGDCYRQFGLLDNAAWAYREGLRTAPDDPRLLLALGTVHYAQGEYSAALQAFQKARDSGADAVVVNYDLSLTLAQTYHFRESDQAIELARQTDEGRLRTLTRGKDHQLLTPSVTAADTERFLRSKDPVTLLNRGVIAGPLARERTFLHPLALAALAALLVAIAHFLIRERTTGLAAACLKCGRPFCRLCKLSKESQSYCSQCVNIFLKKDMVAIDTQLAKRSQLTRFHRARRVERRVCDVLLPGIGLTFAGRPLVGLGLATVAACCLAAGFVWLPRFVGPALLHQPLWPLQIVGGLIWLAAAAAAQLIAAERR